MRLRDLLRGAAVGSALGIVLGYVHSGGYDAQRIRETNDALTEHRFRRRSESDEVHGRLYWISGVAMLGAGFGAVTGAAAATVSAPPALVGSMVGLVSWASVESWYRRMPDAQELWGFPPPWKAASTLALYGAAVAAASRPRLT